ncbi:MAG: alpha/beta hydrolase [Flammeovirgaceae bacterium]|nr:alpha/beta hydrolase [Flammeovirgaceae bacterium]
MQVSHNFLTYDACQLHYVKAGHGPKTILVFHGFGQNHQTFEKLVGFVPADYTIYSFDIFFHGESKWNKGEQLLKKEFWNNLWVEFLAQTQIEKYSLIGFSMGGKFVLASYMASPKK